MPTPASPSFLAASCITQRSHVTTKSRVTSISKDVDSVKPWGSTLKASTLSRRKRAYSSCCSLTEQPATLLWVRRILRSYCIPLSVTLHLAERDSQANKLVARIYTHPCIRCSYPFLSGIAFVPENNRQVLTDCAYALTLNANSIKAYYRSSLALLAMERFEECIDCCDRLLKLQEEKDSKPTNVVRDKAVERKAKKDRKEGEAKERTRRKTETEKEMKKAFAVSC